MFVLLVSHKTTPELVPAEEEKNAPMRLSVASLSTPQKRTLTKTSLGASNNMVLRRINTRSWSCLRVPHFMALLRRGVAHGKHTQKEKEKQDSQLFRLPTGHARGVGLQPRDP